MVEEAMVAIMHHKTFSRMLMLDPFANSLVAHATVTVAFPDPELLELGAEPPALAGEVLRKQQIKVLGALDAAANRIKTGQRIVYRGEEVKHDIAISKHTGKPEAGGNVLVEVVTVSTTLLDFRSIHLLKMLAETLLEAAARGADVSPAGRVGGGIGRLHERDNRHGYKWKK
nr:hypothetical protein [Candidatus Sigynarchaeum springense]